MFLKFNMNLGCTRKNAEVSVEEDVSGYRKRTKEIDCNIS